MNSNTITGGGGMNTESAQLAENEHVKELLGILKDNGKDTSGLYALLDHVKGMEDFIKIAENKIEDMKTQLDTIKEIQNHPIKAALQNTVKALETKVSEIKIQIAELKTGIIEGCKNAVAAFKEKGIVALDKLASFFNIRSGLKSISQSIDESMMAADKAIAKIAVFSKEYHQTGRHIKNMGRVLTGKQPIDTVKEAGALAKIVSAPYKAYKKIQISMIKTVFKMDEKLEQLSQSAAQNRQANAEKPTLKVKLNTNKELIRKLEQEKPVPIRAAKAQGLDV